MDSKKKIYIYILLLVVVVVWWHCELTMFQLASWLFFSAMPQVLSALWRHPLHYNSRVEEEEEEVVWSRRKNVGWDPLLAVQGNSPSSSGHFLLPQNFPLSSPLSFFSTVCCRLQLIVTVGWCHFLFWLWPLPLLASLLPLLRPIACLQFFSSPSVLSSKPADIRLTSARSVATLWSQTYQRLKK